MYLVCGRSVLQLVGRLKAISTILDYAARGSADSTFGHHISFVSQHVCHKVHYLLICTMCSLEYAPTLLPAVVETHTFIIVICFAGISCSVPVHQSKGMDVHSYAEGFQSFACFIIISLDCVTLAAFAGLMLDTLRHAAV